jgi:hypothetical protein
MVSENLAVADIPPQRVHTAILESDRRIVPDRGRRGRHAPLLCWQRSGRLTLNPARALLWRWPGNEYLKICAVGLSCCRRLLGAGVACGRFQISGRQCRRIGGQGTGSKCRMTAPSGDRDGLEDRGSVVTRRLRLVPRRSVIGSNAVRPR